jgi:hypothetical protein
VNNVVGNVGGIWADKRVELLVLGQFLWVQYGIQ